MKAKTDRNNAPGQGRQTVPLGAAYVPALHSIHCSGDVAASSPPTDPAAHSEQEALKSKTKTRQIANICDCQSAPDSSVGV